MVLVHCSCLVGNCFHLVNSVAIKLFEMAEAKESKVVLSADLTTTDELLEIADSN